MPSLEERIGVISNALLLATQQIERLEGKVEHLEGEVRSLQVASEQTHTHLRALQVDLDRLLAGEPAEQWQAQVDRVQDALGHLLHDLDRRDGGNGAARKAIDMLDGKVLT